MSDFLIGGWNGIFTFQMANWDDCGKFFESRMLDEMNETAFALKLWMFIAYTLCPSSQYYFYSEKIKLKISGNAPTMQIPLGEEKNQAIK